MTYDMREEKRGLAVGAGAGIFGHGKSLRLAHYVVETPIPRHAIYLYTEWPHLFIERRYASRRSHLCLP